MKKILNLFLIALSVVLCWACTPEEKDIFDQSSANRISEALKVDRDILVGAKNGWLIEYYPSPAQQYGGYNILVSFTEDGKTTVSSDVMKPGDKATSTYRLLQSGGPVLSFDTYNPIMHYFSDPANPDRIGTNGKGMEGDLEFLIVEASKDKIVLRGRKTLNTMVMTPVPENVSWEDYLADVNEWIELFGSYVKLKYADGDFKATVDISYRSFSITYDVDGEPLTIEAPFIITASGNLKFYSPVELNGKSFDELKYVPDDLNGKLVPTNGLAITFTPYWPLSYLLVNNDWYMSLSGILHPTVATNWKTIRDNILNPARVPIDIMLFTPYSSEEIAFYWETNGVAGYLFFPIRVVSDNQIGFTGSLSIGNAVGNTFWSKYSWKYIVAPFWAKTTYTLTGNSEKDPTIITMTDDNNPAMVVKLSKEPIEDPLNN